MRRVYEFNLLPDALEGSFLNQVGWDDDELAIFAPNEQIRCQRLLLCLGQLRRCFALTAQVANQVPLLVAIL